MIANVMTTLTCFRVETINVYSLNSQVDSISSELTYGISTFLCGRRMRLQNYDDPHKFDTYLRNRLC